MGRNMDQWPSEGSFNLSPGKWIPFIKQTEGGQLEVEAGKYVW